MLAKFVYLKYNIRKYVAFLQNFVHFAPVGPITANKCICYIASAETKCDWLIHGHVVSDKCNVSLGQ